MSNFRGVEKLGEYFGREITIDWDRLDTENNHQIFSLNNSLILFGKIISLSIFISIIVISGLNGENLSLNIFNPGFKEISILFSFSGILIFFKILDTKQGKNHTLRHINQIQKVFFPDLINLIKDIKTIGTTDYFQILASSLLNDPNSKKLLRINNISEKNFQEIIKNFSDQNKHSFLKTLLLNSFIIAYEKNKWGIDLDTITLSLISNIDKFSK